MSNLAGVVSRKHGLSPDAKWKGHLRRALSRHDSESIACFEQESAFLLKADSGAYVEPAFRTDSTTRTIAMLAGEPLLACSRPGAGSNRARDLEILQAAFDVGDWDVLRSAQGIFAAVHYQPANRRLHLIADKLGLRPLYYWMDEEWIVFSSALRILEDLPFVPKVMDVRAVTEITCFGYPLNDRTPYDHIRTIQAAEIVSVDALKHESRTYWRWDEIPVSKQPESELLQEAYDRFQAAVQRRLHGDRHVFAFLSGGLDSRCVVAALSSKVEIVHTLNMSLPQTQDRVYGAEIARRLGTRHQEDDFFIGDSGLFPRVLKITERLNADQMSKLDRPLVLWSGDGGSLGLGHIYMTKETVDTLRRGQEEAGIRRYLKEQKKYIVRRVLRHRVFEAVCDTIERGVREEFARLQCDDPGQRMFLFLMLNDQRRHYASYFEEIDRNRLEPLTPFYDSDFLSLVASIPLDLRLLHRFYNKWLNLFQPEVSSTPWQVYAGHEPCPVPHPAGLISQFDRTQSDYLHARRKRELYEQTSTLLRSDIFPTPILRRLFLRLASLATHWRLSDYSYVQEAALTYARYWRNKDARFTLPGYGKEP
jgi:asparagine synthase (glutamine-hydrolysing)